MGSLERRKVQSFQGCLISEHCELGAIVLPFLKEAWERKLTHSLKRLRKWWWGVGKGTDRLLHTLGVLATLCTCYVTLSMFLGLSEHHFSYLQVFVRELF